MNSKAPSIVPRGPRDLLFRMKIRLKLSLILLSGLLLPQASVASFPSQYANLLQLSNYAVYSGDYNNDGRADLLLWPQSAFSLIDYEIPFLVPLPGRHAFLVLSNADGTYTLVGDPPDIRFDPAWRQGTHELIYGDTDGDGSIDMLVRSKTPNGLSVLIATSATDGMPALEQNLSRSQIGVDLGGLGTAVRLMDANGDGRADLIVATNGNTTATLYAAGNGTFSSSGGSFQTVTAVGTISGNFQVSPTGAARYSAPLSVPPGVAGLTPQLAIEYSSQGVDTYMGPGFSISGLSQITRCPSTFANDGAVYGINFNGNDRFCLDGQRLTTAGSYGAINAYYRTEIDGFSRVQSVGGSTGTPSHWIVKTKSGLTMYYGRTSTTRFTQGGSSSRVIAWLLEQTVDSVGNYIDYSWSLPSSGTGYVGGYYPAQITYGGNIGRGTPSDIKILFSYSSASGFYPNGYLYGQRLGWSQILKSVQTSVNGAPVRNWTISYTGAGAGPDQRQVPTAIQECAGSTCLAPTSFTYASAVGATNSQNFGSFSSIDMASYAMVQPGNFDSDSKTDIIGFNVDSNGNGKGFVWKGGQPTASPYTWTVSGLSALGKAVVGDFNGDGLADVAYVSVCCQPNGNYSPGYIDIWYSNGSSYTYSGHQSIGSIVNSIDSAIVGDFYGTGIESILISSNNQLIVSPSQRQIWSQKISFSGGSTFVSAAMFNAVPAQYGGIHFAARWQTEDLNGDGKADAILTQYDPTKWSTYNDSCVFLNGDGATLATPQTSNCQRISTAPRYVTGGSYRDFYADLNNDGLADAIYYFQYGPTMEISYAFNNGENSSYSELGVSTSLTVTLPNGNSYAPVVADLNGDGYGDLALVEQGSSTVHILSFYSVGSGLVAGPTLTFTASTSIKSTLNGDYNGDGLRDLLLITGGSGSSGVSTVGFQGLQHARVSSITNGLGALVSVTYKPLSDGSVYNDDGNFNSGTTLTPVVYPVARLNAPEYAVSQISTTNPTKANRIVNYQYSNARLDLQGRGFLGFGSVSASDASTGLSETTRYAQNFPYVGLITSSVSKITSSGLAFKTSGVQAFVDVVSSYGSHFPYASNATDYTYEISSGASQLVTTTNSKPTYDGHGNLTQNLVVVSGGAYSYNFTTVNRYDQDDENNWCLGRLTNSRLTRSDNGGNDPLTRETSYHYNTTTCLLDQEKIQPNDSTNWLESAYTRDSFGNIATTTVSGFGITTRSRSDVYSSAGPASGGTYGRLKTRDCNFLGQCNGRTFDLGTGVVLNSSDANGVVTNFSYDGFGRLAGTSVSQPGLDVSSSVGRFLCSQQPALCNGQQGYSAIGGSYVVKTSSSDGTARLVVYDATEREVRSATLGGDGVWREIVSGYDAAGRKFSVTAPRLANGTVSFATTYLYDSIGRIYTVTAPSDQNRPTGSVTQYRYNGLSTAITDPNNRTTTKTNNVLGKLVSVADPNTSTVTYGYDTFDNLKLIARTNPNGGAMIRNTAQYDIRGNRFQMRDPDMGTWQFSYDGLGEMTSMTDSVSNVTSMTYDLLGRPVTRNDSDFLRSWTWDARWIGALAEVQTKTSSGSVYYNRSYGYNSFGGVRSDTQSIGGVGYTTNYGFDRLGRVNQITYPNQLTVAVGYNSYGAEVSITNGTATLWAANAWDERNHVYQETLGNRAIVNGVYRDAAVGTIRSILAGPNGGTATANLAYNWDAKGNTQKRINYNTAGVQTETFAYDLVDRLQSDVVTNPSTPTANVSFTQDALGNLTSKSDLGSYTYSGTPPHQVTQIGGTSYRYSAAGDERQVLNGSVVLRNYNWTQQHQLKAVSDTSAGSASFQYGTDGELVQRQTVQGGSSTTVQYLGDGLADSLSNGTWRNYILAPTGPVAMVVQTGSGPGTVQYLQKDNQGSIIAVTDASGSVIQKYVYDTVGRRTITYTASGYSGILTDRGYTGHIQIDSLNLVHMGGRVYDPVRARFLSPDPIIHDFGNLQTLNPYSYVFNNPMSYVDPTGLDGVELGGSQLAGVNVYGFRAVTPPSVAPPMRLPSLNALGGFTGGLLARPANLAGTAIGGQVGNGSRMTVTCKTRDSCEAYESVMVVSLGGLTEDASDRPTDVDGSSGEGLQTAQVGGKFANGIGLSDLPTLPQGAVDAIAGFGDTLSFGFSRWARSGHDGADEESSAYLGGQIAGVAYSMALGGASGVRAAGFGGRGTGMEFSHWIPNRWGGPRSILNGNYVTGIEHALSDPFRYRFMPRTWKALNPLPSAPIQQLNRIPWVLRGVGAGAVYGDASMEFGPEFAPEP